MKKVLFLLIASVTTQVAISQTFAEIQLLVAKNDFKAAKPAIDKFLADPKNAAKPEAIYYKGVIYNEVSKTDATCKDCKMVAFEAFKKYQVMDPKNKLMGEENNVRLFDLYNGYFDIGAKAYNDKNYDDAFLNFQNAGLVEDYIKAKGFEYNGFKFGALDTSLIKNTALAARLAKKDAEAVKYYEKLAAINLATEDDLEMYQYLVQYYLDTKNTTALNTVLAKGKLLYPKNSYWTEVEIDQIDRKDKPALFAKYEEVIAKNPTDYALNYNYAVELFNYLYVGDNKPVDPDAKKARFVSVVKTAIGIQNTPAANLLMSRHLYNAVYDMQDLSKTVKGNKPDDIKKKAEYKATMNKNADDCIKYGDVAIGQYFAMPSLTTVEKANLTNALSINESMYTFRGNVAKAAEYKKKGIDADKIKIQNPPKVATQRGY
jgi:hypothetical protein